MTSKPNNTTTLLVTGFDFAGSTLNPSLPEQVARCERKAPAMPREQLLGQIQRLILLATQGASADKSKGRY